MREKYRRINRSALLGTLFNKAADAAAGADSLK
jgi:hypothetical protein